MLERKVSLVLEERVEEMNEGDTWLSSRAMGCVLVCLLALTVLLWLCLPVVEAPSIDPMKEFIVEKGARSSSIYRDLVFGYCPLEALQEPDLSLTGRFSGESFRVICLTDNDVFLSIRLTRTTDGIVVLVYKVYGKPFGATSMSFEGVVKEQVWLDFKESTKQAGFWDGRLENTKPGSRFKGDVPNFVSRVFIESYEPSEHRHMMVGDTAYMGLDKIINRLDRIAEIGYEE